MLQLHQHALVAAQADGHDIGCALTLNNLGATYFALHDYQQAAANFHACLRLAETDDYAIGLLDELEQAKQIRQRITLAY